MKRKYIVGAVVALLVLAAVVYLYAGSQVPAGQPPLRRLAADSIADFTHEFNAAKNEVRVVILLAPT
jgi:HAMP domain-containing protein